FSLDVLGIKVTVPRLPVFRKDILPIVIYTESQHRRNITTTILNQLAAFKTVSLMIDDAILCYQVDLIGTGRASALRGIGKEAGTIQNFLVLPMAVVR